MPKLTRKHEAAYLPQKNEWKLIDLRERLNLEELKTEKRACMNCQKLFASEGKHHRFCKRCTR